MASTERLLEQAGLRKERATSLEAAFRGDGQLWSFTLLTVSIGALFAASMAGYVLYLTAVARPQSPLMVLVGIMAAFGLLTVMLLVVVFFARHPLIETLRQSEARESGQRYRALFNHAPMGLGLATTDGKILACNEALSKMLGYREKELPRLDMRSIYRDPDDRERLLKQLRLHGFIENLESELKRRDGTTFIANLTSRWLLLDGKKVLFTVVQDITDRKLAESALAEAKREMEILASMDGLTGVANRRFFDERLEVEWKRASREEIQISLLIVDIDFFKSYNDANGHLAGDECLKKVAKVLRGSLRRPTDLLARYGGEEFAALLPNTGNDGALRLAETMKSKIQDLSVIHPDSEVGNRLTVSIGVATMTPQYNSSQLDLIKAADDALYRAKGDGRDCIRISSAPMSDRESLSGRSYVA